MREGRNSVAVVTKEDLRCPVTTQIFFDPRHLFPCGHVLEHDALEKLRDACCPCCRKVITYSGPDIFVRDLVLRAIKANPDLANEQYCPELDYNHFLEYIGRGRLVDAFGMLERSPEWLEAELDETGTTMLHSFAAWGNLEVVEKCLALRPDSLNRLDGLSQTPLMHAARQGRARVVAYLLKQPAIDLRARVNQPQAARNGYTALHLAAAGGHSEVCDQLVRAGADLQPSASVGSPFMVAALPRLRWFLYFHAEIKPELRLALSLSAAAENTLKAAKNTQELEDALIWAREANPELFKAYQEKLLMCLVHQQEYLERFPSLFDRLSEVWASAQDAEGMNVLHRLASCAREQEFKAVVARHPDLINQKSQQGRTVLMRAVGSRSLVFVTYVLTLPEIKASLDAVSVDGSALNIAASYGGLKICELLIRSGIPLNIVGYGKTACQLTQDRGTTIQNIEFMDALLSGRKANAAMHQAFFKSYKPGFFGGSASKFKNDPKQANALFVFALQHARKHPHSATAQTLQAIIMQIWQILSSQPYLIFYEGAPDDGRRYLQRQVWNR